MMPILVHNDLIILQFIYKPLILLAFSSLEKGRNILLRENNPHNWESFLSDRRRVRSVPNRTWNVSKPLAVNPFLHSLYCVLVYFTSYKLASQISNFILESCHTPKYYTYKHMLIICFQTFHKYSTQKGSISFTSYLRNFLLLMGQNKSV